MHLKECWVWCYLWGEGVTSQRPHMLGWDHKGLHSQGKDESVLSSLRDSREEFLGSEQSKEKKRKKTSPWGIVSMDLYSNSP